MLFQRLKFVFIFFAVLFGTFFGWSKVLGQSSGSIGVDMNVPSGSGGPSPTVDNSPTISNVTTSSITYTSAVISWTASDDNGITSSSFEYGTSVSYGQSATISGSYQVNLTNLTTSTDYYFKISVSDGVNPSISATGRFKTLTYSPPPDTTPPVISNISIVTTTNSAVITWTTDELANGQVNYYILSSHIASSTHSNFVTSHSITLNSLLPNTLYHYQIISSDSHGNTTNTAYKTFTTATDTTPPAEANFTSLTTSTNAINLSWINPTDSDFAGVIIRRKTTSTFSNHNDGTKIYEGSLTHVTDNNFNYNTLYYYKIFTYDTSANYSNGVFKSINYVLVPPPKNEICDNNKDDDGDGAIDCKDSDCSFLSICKTENCSNGSDDDGDGLIDCKDPDCFNSAVCKTVAPTENCSNGSDDDGDGLIDCKDPDCSGFSGCQTIINSSPGGGSVGGGASSGGGSTPACSDKIDNDNDGLIDYPKDPGCSDLNDTDEYNPPSSTVPLFFKLDFNKVNFYTGSGQIKLTPINSIVTGLSGMDLIILVNKNDLPSTPSSTAIKINGSQYSMRLVGNNYQTKLNFPSLSIQDAYLEINYGANQFDSIAFKIKGVAFGDVISNNKRIDNAVVSLYNLDNKLASLNIFGEINPYTTNVNGIYGWMVPNNQYYFVVKKAGYYDYRSPIFKVKDNLINRSVSLIAKPAKLADVIKPSASITTNAKNVAVNLGQKASVTTKRVLQKTSQVVQDTAKVINKVADNPKVENVAQTVAPVSVGVVTISFLSFLSFSNLLPLLQFLFLQPLMLLGWNRRRRWGLVYNSLNKQPIDLAIVRLEDANTKRVVQSMVTDRMGRYFFLANPGKYKITVRKNKFVYPSELLRDYSSDGRKANIYHGEEIEVTDDKINLIPNIPLDPIGQHEHPKRLLWSKVGRFLQQCISITGIIITTISLYISPKWYIVVLLAIHIILFIVFKKLAIPNRNKSWGIIYDEQDKKPISRVVVRLFNARFNKLISSRITDRKGRYQFLAGDDDYYVTYNKAGYDLHKKEVDLKGQEAGVIDEDVELKKNNKE